MIALPGSWYSRLAFSALVAYWLLLIYQLGAQWSIYQQYNYGWAVPFLCAYLLWQSSGRTASDAVRQASPASRRSLLLSSFFILLLLYAPTRFVHEANPVWRMTSLLWTLEIIALTLLVIRLAFGRERLAQLAFPICFFLVAVPWPYPVETLLVDLLTRLNVGTTIELLGLFGVPAVQHGNVIEIGTGMVGIDEACSGIRSFQATLMISLFLGEFYRLGIFRRVLCVLAGFVFAFIFNVGRTLLLTRVASLKGTGAIAAWHDPAGVSILVACFLSLWLLALWMGRPQKAESEKLAAEVHALEPVQTSVVPLYLRLCSIGLAAWFVLVEGGTQAWYCSHERADSRQQNWSMQPPAGYKTKEVDKLVTSEFKYDEGFETEWEDANKAHWQLFYFRWNPARALERRVRVQRVKMHGPATCLTHIGMTMEAELGTKIITVGNLKLAVQHSVFAVEGQPLDVFFGIYEDQTGSATLANRRLGTASRVEAALKGSRNYGQRFLEIAVRGYDRANDAEAALARELESLIRVSE